MGGCQELAAAQARWPRTARRAASTGAEPGAVFAVARAVVCGWWQQEAFWEREQVWSQRLERITLDTSRRSEVASEWPAAWWQLVARDAVVFPEVVAVAAALVDPALRLLVTDERPLVRRSRHNGRFVTALGERLERGWLGEAELTEKPSALQAWMRGLAREVRSPSLSGSARREMWRVQAAHQPAEVGAGLRLLATSPTRLPTARRVDGVAGRAVAASARGAGRRVEGRIRGTVPGWSWSRAQVCGPAWASGRPARRRPAGWVRPGPMAGESARRFCRLAA
ncbi:hypothetical protein SAV14893_093780 [Streptomyces avermitilis]|uniref:Uncharacterized protein n=1 Tax=Streptomyces avermitilis TaxID=33903 RepID=A0A4D4MDV6_STRAX|nr:hypothetical protein SAV14893_093780 [Streptomyces avermitilis]